ncbi:MAG: NTP transferase domain-containing protein [Archaeoglobi archaeon]|nr:NTP transferase domain-containing protein [Archaeoglobi archaeon]
MLAIVMCGGRGSRLGFVEKPMISVGGKRLVEGVMEELELAGLETVFVTSPFTPETERFLREMGLEVFRADGGGYMHDLRQAVFEYRIIEPVLNVNSDLYFRERGVILRFLRAYLSSSSPAMSAVFPSGRRVGINAFDPVLGEQREEKFIIEESRVINIDTPGDLERLRDGRVL